MKRVADAMLICAFFIPGDAILVRGQFEESIMSKLSTEPDVCCI